MYIRFLRYDLISNGIKVMRWSIYWRHLDMEVQIRMSFLSILVMIEQMKMHLRYLSNKQLNRSFLFHIITTSFSYIIGNQKQRRRVFDCCFLDPKRLHGFILPSKSLWCQEISITSSHLEEELILINICTCFYNVFHYQKFHHPNSLNA